MKNIEKYQTEIVDNYRASGISCEFIKKYVLKRPDCVGIQCIACAEKLRHWLSEEYELQIDWSKVAKDSPIVVLKEGCQVKAHFAFYEPNWVTFYDDGKTSWTGARHLYTVPEKNAKLAREEDIEKYSI